MPTFFFGVASLVGLAVVMISVLPRVWQRRGRAETNADWLRLRQRELDGDEDALKRDAALRIVEEGEGFQDAPEQAAPQYAWWMQGVAAGL